MRCKRVTQSMEYYFVDVIRSFRIQIRPRDSGLISVPMTTRKHRFDGRQLLFLSGDN